ncbi:DUF5819 family protein [Streptomyces sp. NPDC000618]|uniref:DUF5819 family protein n=1 Tax=Streptomyces sp. NPDC000618 TaxID=3154265 RepID=UPI00332482C8
MDAYDGGSGAPRGRNTSGEAETDAEAEAQTPPEEDVRLGDVVPRPRTELPSTELPSTGLPSTGLPSSEPGSRAAVAADGPGAEPAAAASAADPAAGPSAPLASAPGLAAEPHHAEPHHAEPRTGVAALSPRYQVGAALALAVVAVAVCVHVGMVFLHVAPQNTVTKAHGRAIDEWVYPEFEQNWKLFAPNPLQQNIAVQVRAQVRTVDGGSRTTGWYDLSAQDGRAIDGNLLPSHTQQNELRRAWDFFTATHNNENRPVGVRGALSETYLRHIVVLRLERGGVAGDDGVVERIQIRSQTTNVTPPKWSTEKVSMSPVYRELSWWSVPTGETEGGAR